MNLSKLKKIVIDILKGQAIKFALKKILGSAIIGGPKAWIIKFIVTELFEEVAEPLIKLAFRKMGYAYNKVQGEVFVKKLDKANEENDEQAFNDAIDFI